MNGTIACVVDESEGAEAAVYVARRLAEQFEARIVLVGVGLESAGGDNFFAAHRVGTEDYRIAAGDPAEAVAVIATEEAADLIVVGGRRRRLGRVVESEFARELAATASCPVVLVPPEAAVPLARRAPLTPALG